MPNYQIKFTPVDTYFFGGEKHRLKKGANNQDRLIANYFVESNPYPQQTTLLGCLRYYLLFCNKLLLNSGSTSVQKDDAKQLIGEKSFEYGGLNDFKTIAKISSLYFLKDEEAYHFAPFDIDFDFLNEKILQKDNKNFKAKDHNNYNKYSICSHQLISMNNEQISLNDIVKTESQVGNKIAKPNDPNTEGFYKMNKKKLKQGWSFAVDVEFDEAIIKQNDAYKLPNGEAQFLPFGGEKSIFKIEAKEQQAQQFALPKNFSRTKPFIYLTSDAFAKNDLMKLVEIGINQFVSFRCLTSNISTTTHFNDLPEHQNKKGGIARSKRHQLLKRGSTLYFKNNQDRDTFISALEKGNENNIGFNKYLTN